MKKIGLGKLARGIAALGATSELEWQPKDQVYPRLLSFSAAALARQGGLYAVWHLGVRPQWLRVGATQDLGGAVAQMTQTPWLRRFEANAGIFLAWALVPGPDRGGFARFLAQRLRPAFQDAPLAADDRLEPETTPRRCPLPPGTHA